VGLVAALAACAGSLSPLSNRLAIGEEAYVVFVADVPDGAGELFAAPAAGGAAWQFTFTRLDERLPALSPDGGMVAFVRAPGRGDAGGVAVWVMNLLSGAERRLTEVEGLVPDRLAWSRDGGTIYVHTAAGVFGVPAPPSRGPAVRLSGDAALGADSALMVLLGDPPIARAAPCRASAGLCAVSADGGETVLAVDGRDPVRWGADSVAYLAAGGLVVRPLAGGLTRTVRWARGPAAPRQPTYFPGKARQ
jgi:hypothetical protein